jgi:hypothetical protein
MPPYGGFSATVPAPHIQAGTRATRFFFLLKGYFSNAKRVPHYPNRLIHQPPSQTNSGSPRSASFEIFRQKAFPAGDTSFRKTRLMFDQGVDPLQACRRQIKLEDHHIPDQSIRKAAVWSPAPQPPISTTVQKKTHVRTRQVQSDAEPP